MKKKSLKKKSRYKLTSRVKLTSEQMQRAKQQTGKMETAAYQKQKDGNYKKSLATIKGVGLLWQKAKKYVLVTHQIGRPLFVGDNDILKLPVVNELDEPTNLVPLTFNINEALKFALGFDDAELKIKHWNQRTGLKFLTKPLHNETKK